MAAWIGAAAAMAIALAVPAHAQGTGSSGVGSPFELAFWTSVDASGEIAQYEAYLQRYPAGTFSELALLKIAAIRRERGEVPAAVPVAPAQPASVALPVPQMAVAAPAPAVPVAMPLAEPVPIAPLPAPAAPAPPQALPAAPVAALVAPPPAPASASLPAPLPAAPAALAPEIPEPTLAPAPTDVLSLTERLRRFSAEQAAAAAPTAPTVAAVPSPLPPRPALASVPDVVLPASFCSAEARNAFHDSAFLPARTLALENNRITIEHMDHLRALYDQFGRDGDVERQTLVAHESGAYKPVADAAFAASVEVDRLYGAILAVPVQPCG